MMQPPRTQLMKIKRLLTLMLIAGALSRASLMHATLINLSTLSSGPLNTPITDGSVVGIRSSLTENTAPLFNSVIQSVSVNLNISGGYNGDLTGYLILQDADGHNATVLLLNRVGTTSGDPFGSEGAGFTVTLSDSGTVNGDIHNATGSPTGTWLPDQSAGAASLDSTFGGLNGNGTWTLFLTDASLGNQSTLQSWSLDVAVVPEPVTWALLVFLGIAVLVKGIQTHRRQRMRTLVRVRIGD